jgi:Domain of unknown function (DUF4440)
MKRVMGIGVLIVGIGLSGANLLSQPQNRTRSSAQMATEAQVFGAEEQFRRAKVQNDTAALAVLLSDQFLETNQNGNSRNKAGMIELFRTFTIESLTTDTADLRFATDGIAIVNGSQTEENGSGTDRMLFTRVWVRDAGSWQILSSTQFRNPRLLPFSIRRTGFIQIPTR